VDQEEVLIAMMFDDFMGNDMKSLDYDRIRRCAISIQNDEDVCRVLGGTPVPQEECWVPEDAWITDMCFAFSSTEQQLTARSYPAHDITPPAMTMLIERGSELRTGIKSTHKIRIKPGGGAGGGHARSAGHVHSSGGGQAGGSGKPRGAAAAAGGSASAPPAKASSPSKKKAPVRRPSPRSAAADAASLLADPRPKATGEGGKKKKGHASHAYA
jgi:hypothetical protein